MGITCCCVCALGDSTMCQCLCGYDSQCVVSGHVRPCYPEWGILGDISAPVSLVLGLCWAEVMWLTQAWMLMLLLCKVLADRRVCLPGLQMCVYGLCSNCLWNCLPSSEVLGVATGAMGHHLLWTPVVHFTGWVLPLWTGLTVCTWGVCVL